MNKMYDVIIIGAGPSGIASAIQLKRHGIDFLILEKEGEGGLLKNASLVENYPGFPKGITGLKLVVLFKKHLSKLGVGIKKGNVIDVNFRKGLYIIKTEKNIYTSKYLIIASGTKPKTLNIKNYSHIKIYYDIYKLFDIRKKDIAIIGGGDVAFDYAVSLSKNGNNVYILHRGSKPSCVTTLLKKVLLKKNISYFCNLKFEKIHKEKNKIIIECNGKRNFKVDYLIAAIGREPQLDFIKEGKKNLFDKLKDKSLFLIGDVKNEIYRQATISIGDGIFTAMRISKKIIYESNS